MTIGIVGTGNAAWALGKLSKNAGHDILFVLGRDEAKAIELAKELSSKPIVEKHEISAAPDITLLAVSDDSISQVCKSLAPLQLDTIMTHLSGSTSITSISEHHSPAGVVYPMQTLRKGSVSRPDCIPFYINATDAESLAQLRKYAQSLSTRVFEIDDEQRRKLHLAAVITNNFINYQLIEVYDFLQEQQISFQHLKPLFEETMNKFTKVPPEISQTGPAKRGDLNVIKKHLDLLKSHHDLYEMYYLFSKLIYEKFHPKEKFPKR